MGVDEKVRREVTIIMKLTKENTDIPVPSIMASGSENDNLWSWRIHSRGVC